MYDFFLAFDEDGAIRAFPSEDAAAKANVESETEGSWIVRGARWGEEING